MIEYINKALKYTDGYSYEEFILNEEKVDATISLFISKLSDVTRGSW